jgi:hypothetical protein
MASNEWGSEAMKRFIPYFALLVLVVTAGCAGDSPSAKPVPTVVPEAWSISALTASSTGPFVDTVILVEATVTRNGSPAPDDTLIKFEATGGAFASGTTQASVLTEGGAASVAFFADVAGTYVIRARIQSASRELAVQYQDRSTTDALQLVGIAPRRGSYAGGDQVLITGKGIQSPVEVYFDLDGFPYQAIVVGVTESDPLSAEGTITVITPAFTGTNTGIQQTADVRVETNAGTGAQETDTLPDAFVLLPGGGPAIFGVVPSSGRSSGGEVVNVLGQGFGSVASDLSVSFTDTTGVVKLGTVIAVSPDGSQIQVETPLFSTIPLTTDEPQDVTVATVNGVVSLEDAFIVLADNPQPRITGFSPLAGPLDGGTEVTIFGHGFQVPLQVTFGNLTALDVNVFNDTTPADQDRITCVTPDYSQQEVTPPASVSVTVTNLTSGLTSTAPDPFVYGDVLFISGNQPSEGGLGDLVIIYGSGFEDPLQVFLAGEQMEVISISGTELVVRIPDDLGTSCSSSSGAFEVVLLESNLATSGGNFTIIGNSPTVLSVSPIIFQEGDLGLPGADITIIGQSFADEVLVQVGTYIMPSSDVTVTSDTSIDVEDLPDAGTLGIIFAFSPCTLPGGEPGEQASATPLSVTVTNFPGACPDTLAGAMVIEPTASVCTATPALLTFSGTGVGGTSVTFGTDTVDGGATCVNRLITAMNVGGATAMNVGAAVASGTDFNVVGGTCDGAIDVPYLGTCTVSVDFCAAAVGTRTDTLSISYLNGLAPSQDLDLTGTGAAP